jgi:hypothetical protein
MSDVLMVTAGMLIAGAVLMAAFLPARAPKTELPTAEAIELKQPAGVAS